MTLVAAKDPNQCADRCWVAVDTEILADGPYSVNGHAVTWMPDVVSYYLGEKMVTVDSPRRYFKRKRDVLAAIAKAEGRS